MKINTDKITSNVIFAITKIFGALTRRKSLLDVKANFGAYTIIPQYATLDNIFL